MRPSIRYLPMVFLGMTLVFGLAACGGGGAGGMEKDNTPPTSPTGLSAVAVSPSQIDLAWTASADNVEVTGYKVYESGGYIKTVTGATVTSNTGLSPAREYCYRVSAIDAAGNESGQSNEACATTEGSSQWDEMVWGEDQWS